MHWAIASGQVLSEHFKANNWLILSPSRSRHGSKQASLVHSLPVRSLGMAKQTKQLQMVTLFVLPVPLPVDYRFFAECTSNCDGDCPCNSAQATAAGCVPSRTTSLDGTSAS